MRFLGLVIAALAATLLLALSAGQALAKPTQEQRVTELASQLPLGTQDTGVCGAQRHGCDIEVTPDGRHLFFAMNQGPLYERTGNRTTVVSTGPLGTGVVGTACYPYNDPCGYHATDNGQSVAFSTRSSLIPEDTGGTDIYLRSGGVTRLVSTVKPPPDPYSYNAYLAGMSADASRVWYREASYDESDGLYEWSGGKVTRFPSDATPALDAHIFQQGASRDGRRVFFETATPLVSADTNNLSDVYERTLDGQIKLISVDANGHAGGGGFDSASSDGSTVIFSSDALTPDDTDSEGDIYERAGNTTTLLTPGTSSSLLSRLLPDGTSPWRSVYFLKASADGSHVFFESDEPLVPEDKDRGGIDVYEHANGETILVSTSSQTPNWFTRASLDAISPDGTRALFATDEPLTPNVPDSCRDLYGHRCYDLYERSGNTTTLVSTWVTGNTNYYLNWASPDLQRLFFTTDQALSTADRDFCADILRGCDDIYESYKGVLTLISTGPTDDQGNCEDLPDFGCPRFIAASPSGRTVYFQTRESLTPDDTDGDQNDIYVSRVVSPGCQPKSNGKSPKKC